MPTRRSRSWSSCGSRIAYGALNRKAHVFSSPTPQLRCGREGSGMMSIVQGHRSLEVAAVVSAANPDLSAFRARGGKLLLAHGWSDPAFSARLTIEYFKAAAAHAAGLVVRAAVPDAGGAALRGRERLRRRGLCGHHPSLGGAGGGTIAHHHAQTPRHAGGTSASAACVPDDGEVQRYRQHRWCGVYQSIGNLIITRRSRFVGGSATDCTKPMTILTQKTESRNLTTA